MSVIRSYSMWVYSDSSSERTYSMYSEVTSEVSATRP